MNINKEWLKAKSACQDGYGWFVGKKYDAVDIVTLIDALIDEQHLDWGIWLLCRALPKLDLVRLAVFSAEQVIDIYEKQYPNDNRPRKAIEAAKAYIYSPTAAAAEAADEAAAEAEAAAAAAAAAADAAEAWRAAAAAEAAAAAADAAEAWRAAAAAAAADAAEAWRAAAAAADADAAWRAAAAMKTKILKYGVQLASGL